MFMDKKNQWKEKKTRGGIKISQKKKNLFKTKKRRLLCNNTRREEGKGEGRTSAHLCSS